MDNPSELTPNNSFLPPESVARLLERGQEHLAQLQDDFITKAKQVLANIERDRVVTTPDGVELVQPILNSDGTVNRLGTASVDRATSYLGEILVELDNTVATSQKPVARIMNEFRVLVRAVPDKIGTYFADYTKRDDLCTYDGYYYPDGSIEGYQDEIESVILKTLKEFANTDQGK